MIIVNILRDGSVCPPLNQDRLIVKLLNGNLLVGKFEKENYLNHLDNYITEPLNAFELKNELIKLINVEMPELFSKYYIVHIICPKSISEKVNW